MLFDNLSPKADFSSKITTKLDTLNKNVIEVIIGRGPFL